MAKIILDFETASEWDLDFGTWNYSKHPSTRIHCLSWCNAEDDSPAEIWIPGETPEPPFARVDSGDFFEAHNAGFEISMWMNKCVTELGWVPMPLERWSDSMAKCAAHALPLALDKAGAALNLSVQKDAEGKRNMQQLAKPRKPSAARPERWYDKGICEEWDEKFRLLYEYCKTDVLAERALAQALPELSDAEKLVWYYNMKINMRGVPIDIPAVEASLRLFDEFKLWADKESYDITDGAVTSLRQLGQFKVWLAKTYPKFIPSHHILGLAKAIGSTSDRAGIVKALSSSPEAEKIYLTYKDKETKESATALNKDTLVELLKREDLPDEVRDALELRKDAGKSSVSKLIKMKNCADAVTSRIPWCFQYHAASTGREGGRLIQPQNMSKPSSYVIEIACRANNLSPDEDPIPLIIADLQTKSLEELVEKYESPMQAVSGCLRGFIKAPEGREFIAADYNAIEARIVFWLANEAAALQMYRNGDDLYSEMASTITGKNVTKKTHPKERDLGKATILGCGFGMSWQKFLATCQKQGMDIDEKTAKKAVKAYRTKFSGVPKLWDTVGDAAVQTLLLGQPQSFGRGFFSYNKETRFLYMNLPSGRAIAYYHPLLTRVKGYGNEMKWELSFMGTDPKTKQWVRERTWGSKLVENLVQAIARDIMVEGIQRVEAAGYEVIMTVHDEVVAEVNVGFGEVEEFEAILVDTGAAANDNHWTAGLPLAAEGFRAGRYRK